MTYTTDMETIQETGNLLNALQSSLTTTHNSKIVPPYKETALAMVKETNVVTPKSTIADQDTPPVPFELWETLAYDLALENNSHNAIAEAYYISYEQLKSLQENKYFAKVAQAKKDEVKQLGSDAAFTVKMRMVANKATPQLLARLTDNTTNNRDFLAMFKVVTELAKLTPQQEVDNQPVIGANVTFNIQGVPGLEHLSPTNTITDAEFNEVINELSTRSDDELGEL